MDKLKPCPFCGKSVYLEKVQLWRNNGTTTHGYFGCYEFVVKCRNIQYGVWKQADSDGRRKSVLYLLSVPKLQSRCVDWFF